MSLRIGRYETLGVIGTGGMATVYLGRAVGEGGFERLVALKVMHPHIAKEPEFVAMFLDEARLAARIRHPNVVATLDVQRSDEGLFLVMDYVEGQSLRAILRQLRAERATLDLGMALRIVVDMLTGLHAAHELKGPDGSLFNLVHRDVSPHNILVGADGVSRLTDFGVARAEFRLSSTRGTSLKGKLAYMSKEQLMAEKIDRRSDVYAAGVVLWEALVGKRLFAAPSDGALVTMILAGARRSPRQANERVSRSIDYVCMQALSIEPSERYESAEQFVEAIEAAAQKDGIRIDSPRTLGRFVKELTGRIEASPAADSLPSASSGVLDEQALVAPSSKSAGAAASDTVSEPSEPARLAPKPIAEPPTADTDVITESGSLISSPSVTQNSSTSTEAVLSAARATVEPLAMRAGFGPRAKIALALGAALALLVAILVLAGGDDSDATRPTPAAPPVGRIPAEPSPAEPNPAEPSPAEEPASPPPSPEAKTELAAPPPPETAAPSARASNPPRAKPKPKPQPLAAVEAKPEPRQPPPAPRPKKTFHTDKL